MSKEMEVLRSATCGKNGKYLAEKKWLKYGMGSCGAVMRKDNN